MQKNNWGLRAIFGFFFLAASFWCGNQGVLAAEEKIDSFDADIRLNADASVDITENIRYDFGDQQKHGIYRYVPVRYTARGGNYNVRLSDISVTDENGAPYGFTVAQSGDNKEIKIGSAESLVSGEKIYVIRYRMERVINYFDINDEFYWNVTGNGFRMPIEKASAKVYYPRELKKEEAAIACYAGALGSQEACVSAEYIFAQGGETAAGAYFTAQSLAPGEGLTVIAGLPKGAVYQPSEREMFLATLRDNLILFVPLFMLLVAYYLWRKKGKDPAGRGTIITEFDVPENVTPSEAGTIVDESCTDKELTAEIIELAIKGYLKIRREEKKVLLIKSADYVFLKLKDADEGLSVAQQVLFTGIFGTESTVKLSDLKGTFYKQYNDFIKKVYSAVSQKGYFVGNPRQVQGKYFALYLVALILVFILIFLLTGSTPGAYAAISFIISFVIAGTFAYFMPRKTPEGVLLREKILGLKEYLRVAEKDRLKFHNAPEKDPQTFEQLLPYAIVLGVEKEWAKQFEDIYRANPSWYEDSRGFDHFTALYFVNSLNDFRGDFRTSASPAASGSSGLGGGGFSGGGFGGGGGGSW